MITLLVKVLGYAEKLVLANYFGTSYQVDVYTVVLTLVLSLFFFFREIVEPGFLNVFLDAKNKGNEVVSWNLFNKGLRLIFLITFMISLFSFIFSGMITTVFAPGFEGQKTASFRNVDQDRCTSLHFSVPVNTDKYHVEWVKAVCFTCFR
ncbi:MAG: hypothetical protein AB2L24_20440 [Mangrovibacterium sp.]